MTCSLMRTLAVVLVLLMLPVSASLADDSPERSASEAFDLYVSEFVILDDEIDLQPGELNARFDGLEKNGSVKKLVTQRASVSVGLKSEFFRMEEVTLLDGTAAVAGKTTRTTSNYTIGSALSVSLSMNGGEREIDLRYENQRLNSITPETTLEDLVNVQAKSKFTIPRRKRVVLKTIGDDDRAYLLVWMLPRKASPEKTKLSKKEDAPIKEATAEEIVKIFSLENADSDELKSRLEPIFGDAGTDRLTLVSDKRTNAIIARGARAELKILEAMLVRLDEPKK